MTAIYRCGSEEQQAALAAADGDAATRSAPSRSPSPSTGRTRSRSTTSARRDGDSWVLDGTKKWIGNASIADVVVVWARDTEDEQVKGFLVEKGTAGLDATVITGKGSLRAVWQAEISLDGVRVRERTGCPERALVRRLRARPGHAPAATARGWRSGTRSPGSTRR